MILPLEFRWLPNFAHLAFFQLRCMPDRGKWQAVICSALPRLFIALTDKSVSNRVTRPIGSFDMIYSSLNHIMDMLNPSLLLTPVASSAIIAYHHRLSDFTLSGIRFSTYWPIRFIGSLIMSCDIIFPYPATHDLSFLRPLCGPLSLDFPLTISVMT